MRANNQVVFNSHSVSLSNGNTATLAGDYLGSALVCKLQYLRASKTKEPGSCIDTDTFPADFKDSNDAGCASYTSVMCSTADDSDFKSTELCCACGGR